MLMSWTERGYLFPDFILSKANQLLALAPYLVDRYDRGIDLLILLSAREHISQNAEVFL